MILNSDPECLPPKITNKARMSTLTTLIQRHTGRPRPCNKAIQEIKGVQLHRRK